MSTVHITRLSLSNFRNYHAAKIDVSAQRLVLVGPNGAGKTNVLEAISLLTPGRGLRRATFDEIAFSEGHGGWAVSVETEAALGLATLGTGIEPPGQGMQGAPITRQCRVDREPVASVAAFADHLRVLWLVPAMDSLFSGPASERRRFLDRLVLAVDSGHSARVAALDRSLRSRNRLLEDSQADSHWLDAVEHETAELAVAVAALRAETVQRLQAAISARDDGSVPFPAAAISLAGWMEQALLAEPAVAVEDRYRDALRANRSRDAQAGRTLDGPHLTDFAVRYAAKNIPAADASTGEQKALLIGLIMAHARLITDMTGSAPLLLLDEVVAHLDPARRDALYATLESIGSQVWMTGADPAAFASLAGRAQICRVDAGMITAT